MFILVANKIYRYFWSLVFRWTSKWEYMGRYCEHEV